MRSQFYWTYLIVQDLHKDLPQRHGATAEDRELRPTCKQALCLCASLTTSLVFRVSLVVVFFVVTILCGEAFIAKAQNRQPPRQAKTQTTVTIKSGKQTARVQTAKPPQPQPVPVPLVNPLVNKEAECRHGVRLSPETRDQRRNEGFDQPNMAMRYLL